MTSYAGTLVCRRRWLAILLIMVPAFGAHAALEHSADPSLDFRIDFGELLRGIQLYNSDVYSCSGETEDGYAPGAGDQTCTPHASDYDTQDWQISLSELLRLIQLYHARAYGYDESTEDGFNALFDEADPTGTILGESGRVRGLIGDLAQAIDPPEANDLMQALMAAESGFSANML